MNPTTERLQPCDLEMLRRAFAGVELPAEDGIPLETEWHRTQINLLIDSIKSHFSQRDDCYAGGNQFIYFNPEQRRDRDFRGPDFFFVWGRPAEPARAYWAVWDEAGHYPNVIVELTSPSTEHKDRGEKFAVYEQMFQTPEYYLCDPDSQKLEGFRLDAEGNYQPIVADERGWLWSEQLQLWLGWWDGAYQRRSMAWLRYFADDGTLVPTETEAERTRTETERTRAEAAEAELARLRAAIATASPPRNGH